MKIGVLSDTHGEIALIGRAILIFQNLNIHLIVHCGDVGNDIVPLLKGLRAHFVDGNIDNADQLRESITDPGHTFHNHLGTLELEGRKVAFLHGHDIKLLRHTIHSGHWDLVCYGHSHTFSKSQQGQTLVLNPGALARTNRPTLAVVDLPSLEVTEIPL
jgi:uncharacterized protein